MADLSVRQFLSGIAADPAEGIRHLAPKAQNISVRSLISSRSLPSDPQPKIDPADEIILFIHGHMSRAEEALGITELLKGIGQGYAKRYTIIAFDLPSCGYSSMVDHTEVSKAMGLTDDPYYDDIFDTNPTGRAGRYPIVDFYEDFIISFVDALDQQFVAAGQASIKSQNIFVIGGSNGGCMGLRLGRRSDQTWIKKIVAWSPASVWTTWNNDLAKGDAFTGLPGHPGSQARWREVENSGSRQEYFNLTYGPVVPGHGLSQADQWFREGWPCKDEWIKCSMSDRQDNYNSIFRRWHWRLGAELLIFSFWNRDTPSKKYRFNEITIPTLLAAGNLDDFDAPVPPGSHWLNIYSNSKVIANNMVYKGQALWFQNCGHSIDTEYPTAFANAIVDFLRTPAVASLDENQSSVTPADEPCNAGFLATYPLPPPPGADVLETLPLTLPPPLDEQTTWRLVDDLRAAARTMDPLQMLKLAAVTYYFGASDPVPNYVSLDPQLKAPLTRDKAYAFADLAVTGRGAYNAFKGKPPQYGDLLGSVGTSVTTMLGGAAPDATRIGQSVSAVLDRAYGVAVAVRGDPQSRYTHRPLLGWIAVSAEDDPPDRPVNVPSAPYPQHDVSVTCHGLTFQTRYMVAAAFTYPPGPPPAPPL